MDDILKKYFLYKNIYIYIYKLLKAVSKLNVFIKMISLA